MRPIRLFLLAGSGILSCVFGQQPASKLTARELFYSAVDNPPVAVVKKPAAKPKPAQKTSRDTAKNQAPEETPNPKAPVVNAAYRQAGTGPALGLRYTILKKAGDGQAEVGPDTVFHAGDRIRLAVEANDNGYLYVVTRGSSGTWKLLFPSPEIKDGDNRIKRRLSYEIPAGYTFTFDEHAGEEKLFVVLSRHPEPDLEALIYSLGQPGAGPAGAQKPKVMLASAAFSDDVIGKLRNAYSRDLIVEKVDDAQPGPKKEQAVYAVNPSGGADSRVVADVTLKHQ